MNYFYKNIIKTIVVSVVFAHFPSLIHANRPIKIGSPSSILDEVESLSKIRKEKSEESTFYNFKSNKKF